MTSRALTGRTARPLARSSAGVRTLVARFDKDARIAIERLAAGHPYLRDLLWSFPGVLFALAAARDGAARESACALVKAGAPLASVARRLRVAGWMRKLPPEAFKGAVPQLPDDPAFTLQIANHLPAQPKEAAAWLETVAAAYTAAGAPFAIWAARQAGKFDLRFGAQGALVIGLYAWYSARRDTVAGALIARPFSPGMCLEAARDGAAQWLEEMEMQLYADLRHARYAHVNPATSVDGITFTRLMTPQELRFEGQMMNHCVALYASDLAKGNTLIYSLSENGERIATLDVRLQALGRPYIYCVLGQSNAEVPHRVWSAVMMWLARWNARGGGDVPAGDICAPEMKMWLALWKPYWLAKGFSEHLPRRPHIDSLYEHQRRLAYCVR